MSDATYEFDAKIWTSDTMESWHFLSLPEEVTDEIDFRQAGGPRRGFGGVPVQVRIGLTTWRTSIFPASKQKTYVLPVKKAVRTAEGKAEGDVVRVTLEVRFDE